MAKVKLPEEYPDNSDISKEIAVVKDEHVEGEKKEPQAVIRKKRTGKKLVESIFPKEDRGEIIDSILFDHVVPFTKELIQNVVESSVEMLLFGESSGRSSRVKQSSGRTNYRGMSTSGRSSKYSRDDDSRSSRRDRERVDLDDILFYSYAKADKAWQSLLDYIDEYGSAKVGDLYDIAGITPPSDWTIEAYGWDDLSPRAAISPVRTRDDDGRLVTMYCLDLPRPYRIGR